MLSKGKIEVSREEMLKAYQRASYCLAQNKCKEKKCLYFNECVGSNLTTIKQYTEQLEQENQALKKGQYSLMESRKKWKIRYYKERKRRKESDKTIEQLIEKLEEDIESYHINRFEIMERNNHKLLKDNVDTTTYNLYRYFITELKEILRILKGEKE